MPPLNNAPYYGGSAPGAEICFVSGDFTTAWPCSLPVISTPFTGDTILAQNDIILLSSDENYEHVPVGSGYNIQPPAPNQTAILIEQEFMVAQSYYVPQLLNSPYNPYWATGWLGTYTNLGDAILVEEGSLTDMGGGIVKFKRTYATVPPTRSIPETYAYQFPGITYPDGSILFRPSFTKIVASRVQMDFFLWDPGDIAPQFPLFPGGDYLNRSRLDQSTGMNPTGVILPEQKYYAAAGDGIDAVAFNIFLGQDGALVDPSTPGDAETGTIPTASQYYSWLAGTGSSNGLPAEIVAEPSCLTQWRGNIYMRKTRFVIAL